LISKDELEFAVVEDVRELGWRVGGWPRQRVPARAALKPA
jgi:hypothetical protein